MSDAERMKIILFTYQKPGFDITVKHKPLRDYTEETGVYYRFAQYLKWPSWIWSFPSVEDYHTDLCLSYMEIPGSWVLWSLEVPEAEVKWVYFSRQMDNRLPMYEYFAPDLQTIRKASDLPLAFVKTPLTREWTMRPTMERGIIEDDTNDCG